MKNVKSTRLAKRIVWAGAAASVIIMAVFIAVGNATLAEVSGAVAIALLIVNDALSRTSWATTWAKSVIANSVILKDRNGNQLLPKTRSTLVETGDGKTVEDALAALGKKVDELEGRTHSKKKTKEN